MSKSQFGFGWKRDLPDHRDFFYAAAPHVLKTIPTSVDLRKQCPAVYNQLNLGSCTANAIAGAVEFDEKKQGIANPFTPSRLFIYYNERVMEHSVSIDSGAQIRDGIKSVGKQGSCPESEWPYERLETGKWKEKPPQKCYTDAKKHKALDYFRVQKNLNQMRGCLAEGYPFTVGFTVYTSFMSDDVQKTGHAPLPGATDPVYKVNGQAQGHAVLAVGFDDAKQWFILRNSWDKDWGMDGYFTFPYAFLLSSDCDDFWTIRVVA